MPLGLVIAEVFSANPSFVIAPPRALKSMTAMMITTHPPGAEFMRAP